MEMSPPARVVWIEIIAAASSMILFLLSPPARVVWIEIIPTVHLDILTESPPARVVWIEICDYII